MAYDIGLKIGIDGEAEFRKAINGINDSYKTLKTEMSSITTAFDKNDQSQEKLGKQSEILTKQIDLQKKKIEECNDALDKAKDKYGENDKVTQSWKRTVNIATGELNTLERQLREANAIIETQDNKWLKLSDRLDGVKSKFQNVGEKLSGIGQTLAIGVTLPVVAAGTAMVNLASDYNESLNKVNVAFGDSAGSVVNWSETTLDSFGIASGTALDMTALFGDMATSMGLPQSEAANMSMSLTGLAGDLASFKNISIDEAMTALNGVFTGETESLKGIGVVMTQTNLDAYALANGFGKTTSEMSQSELVMLRYQYVMEATANAHGDFANTSDGTANSMRVFQESLKELGQEFGQKLLPVITPVIQGLTDMVKRFSEIPDGAQQVIMVLAGIAAVIGPLLIVIGSVANGIGSIVGLFGTLSGSAAVATAGTAGATAATGSLGAAFAALAAPVGIAVAAIAAIAAVIKGAWDNSELFRNSVATAFSSIGETFNQAFAKISEAMAPVVAAFQGFSISISPILQQIGDFLGTYIVPKITEFVNSFVNGFTSIIVAIAPFISAIGNLLSIIGNFVGLVVALLNGDWSGAWQFAQNIGQNAVSFLQNVFQGLYNWVSLIFQSIFDFIKSIWDGIAAKTNEVWSAVTTFLQTTWQAIFDNTIGKITETATGIATKWQETKTDTQTKWDAIKSDLATKWEEIKTNISTKVQEVFNDVSQKWMETQNDSNAKWGGIVSDLTAKAGEIFTNVTGKIKEIVDDLPYKWEDIKNTAGTKWDEIKNRIKNAVENLPGELNTIAVNMLTEIKNGIESTASSVWGAMEKLAGDLLTKFKSALGIASPSKELFAIGQYMIQGLINGLNGDSLMTFVNNMVEEIKAAFAAGNFNLQAAIDFVGSGALEFFKSIGVGGASFGSLVAPVGGAITSGFGYRDDVQGVGSSYHQGIDIGAAEGTPVGAAGAGTVTQAGWNGGYGNSVTIDHGNGLETLYGHLSEVLVNVGDLVSQLQTIGLVGSTGNSTGPHLHFSVIQNGEFVDPSSIFGFDVGSRYIPRDMVAMIHEGEMIVPKAENPYANSGGQIMPGGGSKIEQTVNIYSPTALSPAQTARLNKRAMQELALSF